MIPVDSNGKRLAVGIVETKGYVGIITAANAMLGCADVSFGGVRGVGDAYLGAVVFGPVAAVREAVERGADAAEQVGEVISTHVIEDPAPGQDRLLPSMGGFSGVGA